MGTKHVVFSSFIVFLALCPFSLNAAKAQTLKATLYPLEGERTPLFTLEYSEELLELGKRVVTILHKDLKGELVLRERAYLTAGKLTRYTYEQFQLNESGEIVVRPDEIRFELKRGEVVRKDSEDWDEDFVVPVLLMDTIQAQWEKLKSGGEVKIRLGLVERLETIGFKIFKERELEFRGAPAIELKMKPVSPFIAMIADPIFLVISSDGKQLLSRRGRTPVRLRKDDKWENFDALVE